MSGRRAKAQRREILNPIEVPAQPLEAALIHALGVHAPESFRPWHILTAAALADVAPSDPADLECFRVATGRTTWPTTRAREVWVLSGRGSGKSFWAATMAVALACTFDRRRYPGLQPGEVPVVLLLASDREQAAVLRNFILGLLRSDGALAQMIQGEPTAEVITLLNGVEIRIGTSSYRWTRGRLLLGAVGDEVSFWNREPTANPDHEVLTAVLPGLRLRDSMAIFISTAYARTGIMFDAHERYFGRDGDILIWKSTTPVMNSSFDPKLIEAALARDPTAARAEYFSEFRGDIEGVFTREMLTPVIDVDVRERPADPATVGAIFMDEAGGGVGAKADSFAAGHATAYLDDDGRLCARLDWLLEIRPPYRHDAAIARVAERAQAAGLDWVMGDKFAGEYPKQEAAEHGLEYVASPRTRSDLYLALIPLVTSQRVRLLDHPKLLAQLTGLERTPGRSGRDHIDHGRTVGSHDDLSNVAAGSVLAALDAAEALARAHATAIGPEEAANLRAFARRWSSAPMLPPGAVLAYEDDWRTPVDRRFRNFWDTGELGPNGYDDDLGDFRG